MSRWVYWVSIIAIVVVVGLPLYGIVADPQADLRDLFRLGIDLQGGTSLIYELRAPPGGQAPTAEEARRVIMNRIDPQGTRGYVVRPIGKHRIEIVLPGRQTRVRIETERATAEALDAAVAQAEKGRQAATAATLRQHREAFLAGVRLLVHLRPALWLDDVQTRIAEKVRALPKNERVPYAVVGLEREGRQWASVAVFLAVGPDQEETLTRWRRLITDALATQRDVTRVKRLVGQAGFLEFRIMVNREEDRDKANFERIIRQKQAGQPPSDPRFKWYPLKKGWEWYRQGLLDAWNFVYVVDEEAKVVEALVDVSDGQDVTGQDLTRAAPSTKDGEPIVVFSLRPEAGARMARLTRPEMRGRQMAIILDGVIQSAPVLKATLSDGGIIEGYDSVRERDEVVTVLNSGHLAASLGDPVTERTVGPELGADNIRRGLVASVIGFGLVVLFILVYYRFAGLVADVALLLNLVLIVCIMAMVRQAWTLPGIAGLILSLSMAIDANVLIFERLREERGREGSLAFALKRAYQNAFRTILDANITTLIPAFVLLWPGLSTEEVKGFAVVMIIGIAVSMFTAVVVSRMILETALRLRVVRRLGMFRLFGRPSVDWMRFARPAIVISGTAAALGAVLFFSRGDEKYDIEFTGGTQVELALKVPAGQREVPIDLVRERVAEVLGPTATVQELEYSYQPLGENVDHFLISVPATGPTADPEAVKTRLAEAFKDMRPELGTLQARIEAAAITEAMVRERMREEGALVAPAPPPQTRGAEGSGARRPAAPAGSPEKPAAGPGTPGGKPEAPGPAGSRPGPAEKPAGGAPAAPPSPGASAKPADAAPPAEKSAPRTPSAEGSATRGRDQGGDRGETGPAGQGAPQGGEAPPAQKDGAGAAAPPEKAAGKPAVASTRFIPRHYRRYLGMIRLRVEVNPPLAEGDLRRRIDVYLRERFPELVGTPIEVRGRVPAAEPGEFRVFELWIEEEFEGKRGQDPNPAFWSDLVRQALGTEQQFASTTSFEPMMAAEAWNKAVMAILLSLSLMIVYIWIRFARLASGVAAVVALVHDVVITLGALSVAALVADTAVGRALLLADFKINLPIVGAFLTLVGYSINDTIVVFDRIRENRGRHGDMSVSVVNTSINQVLSRTVLTSTTTFLAVLALYIFAGRASTVHGLAFVMLIGTIVGTYSSIAIASPILVLRRFLFRVYVWAYPVVQVALWAYFALGWRTPAEFFGSWEGWVHTVVHLGWLALTWPVVRRAAAGETWPVLDRSPTLLQTVASVSVLAPVGAVVLGLATAVAPGDAEYTAWTGPATVALVAAIPATWTLARMAWGKRSGGRKN